MSILGGDEEKVMLIVIWNVIGLINLLFLEEISRLSYGLVWTMLMVSLARLKKITKGRNRFEKDKKQY